MDAFDRQVAELRAKGVEPKYTIARKRECTPAEWAANLEYGRARIACPRKRRRHEDMKRRNWLWSKYRLTPPQYFAMLDGQGGVCAVCGGVDVTGKALAVDHNHSTGEVRGLLCHACNTTAGRMNDSPQLLRKLADYIEGNGVQDFDIITFYTRAMEATNERN